MSESSEKRMEESRQYWNDQADSFDESPDHGLRDPIVREAWTGLLNARLPPAPASILDMGCGTGSLSVILAGLGYQVTGIDLSPAMIALAQEKAAAHGHPITFQVMDAAFPQFARRQFDAIICRHLLWALPEPEKVLQRWSELLKQPGRLFLIEGYWHTGAGLHAKEIVEMIPLSLGNVSVQNLSDNPNFWGGDVVDERYAVVADF